MRELVALAFPPGPEFVDALRRVWDAGDAAFPLDVRLPSFAATVQLDALHPHRVLTPTSAVERAGGVPVESGDALVIATSGTTGTPKGVVLTHDAIASSAVATSAHLGIDPVRHHWLCCLPVAHIGGLGVITRALHTATKVTVLPAFSVDAVIEAAAQGATHTSLVLTAYQRTDPALFEAILLGGSAIPALRPPHVIATYGLTETGSGCVYDGWPLPGVEIRIDPSGQVLVRGPMLLRCYRTVAGTADPSGFDPKDPEGWFPTGDLGSLDMGGKLSVLGRAGDLIITGGQNVWPEPVEAVLATVAGVAEVAVIGRLDPEWGHAVTAIVVPADATSPPTLEALRDAAKARLAPYCAPRRLELVEKLPRTALGKLQRNLL